MDSREQETLVGGFNYGASTESCPVDCREALIRKRAYELFNARGRVPGHEAEDWLTAEQELKRHLGE